jgi:hypothetical protein
MDELLRFHKDIHMGTGLALNRVGTCDMYSDSFREQELVIFSV